MLTLNTIDPDRVYGPVITSKIYPANQNAERTFEFAVTIVKSLSITLFDKAVSRGERNKLGELLHGHHIVERLAGSSIETSLDSHEVFDRVF